jgi:heme/copper-type cytochrome/quinol oxidase subunit 2
MKGFRLATALGIPAALIVLAFGSACGSAAPVSTGPSTTVVAGNSVTLHYTAVGPDSPLAKVGPDGKTHDTLFTTDSTNLKVGDKVTIVVENFDDMPHGMVFDALGINQLVKAGCCDGKSTTTTFSFTATKAGTFRWYCPMPCDTDQAQWAMHADSTGTDKMGFMAGTITVS